MPFMSTPDAPFTPPRLSELGGITPAGAAGVAMIGGGVTVGGAPGVVMMGGDVAGGVTGGGTQKVTGRTKGSEPNYACTT